LPVAVHLLLCVRVGGADRGLDVNTIRDVSQQRFFGKEARLAVDALRVWQDPEQFARHDHLAAILEPAAPPLQLPLLFVRREADKPVVVASNIGRSGWSANIDEFLPE